MPEKVRGKIKRVTKETEIRIDWKLRGSGRGTISTGVPFLDHMLQLMTFHGGFDLTLKAKGDLGVGEHHTVEDVGICLGKALRQALEKQIGFRRFGQAVIPMDEALVLTALDLSGRPYLAYAWKPRQPYVERLEAGLIKEFFRALVTHAGMNLHLKVMAGENSHHIVEAMFKGLGRALRMAVSPEGDGEKVPSTKGIL